MASGLASSPSGRESKKESTDLWLRPNYSGGGQSAAERQTGGNRRPPPLATRPWKTPWARARCNRPVRHCHHICLHPGNVTQLCRGVTKMCFLWALPPLPNSSPTERENTTVRHWHTICIMAVQNALTEDWDVESSLQKVLDQCPAKPAARPIKTKTGEDVFFWIWWGSRPSGSIDQTGHSEPN